MSPSNLEDRTPLAGHRLLVVDDNEVNRRLLVEIAHRWELSVAAVSNGEQALACLRDAAARQQPFDCAALDMHMPDIDGIELAQAIHQDESFPHPALVMLTELDRHRREARNAGIDVQMTKPVRRAAAWRARSRRRSGSGHAETSGLRSSISATARSRRRWC